MKKSIIFAIVLSFLSGTVAFADKIDYAKPESAISLGVIIPKQADNLPAGARSYLKNKLKQMASKNGLSSGTMNSRFFITAQVTPLTKDIISGPPQQIAQNLEITLYIADYVDQKVFSTTSLNVKGVGTNETKSLITGIKYINVNNKDVAAFIEDGKQEIISYYNSQCDNIIKEALSLARQKEYELALYKLSAIPSASTCFDKGLETTSLVYQQYIDHLCIVNLAQAKTAWAAEQNSTGAKKAGAFLAYIYPDAKCYDEAMVLYTDIRAKVLDDWIFEMKQYQDMVDLESQRIEAARQVGIAYGENQPEQTITVGWLFR